MKRLLIEVTLALFTSSISPLINVAKSVYREASDDEALSGNLNTANRFFDFRPQNANISC